MDRFELGFGFGFNFKFMLASRRPTPPMILIFRLQSNQNASFPNRGAMLFINIVKVDDSL